MTSHRMYQTHRFGCNAKKHDSSVKKQSKTKKPHTYTNYIINIFFNFILKNYELMYYDIKPKFIGNNL